MTSTTKTGRARELKVWVKLDWLKANMRDFDYGYVYRTKAVAPTPGGDLVRATLIIPAQRGKAKRR